VPASAEVKGSEPEPELGLPWAAAEHSWAEEAGSSVPQLRAVAQPERQRAPALKLGLLPERAAELVAEPDVEVPPLRAHCPGRAR
jgi:hypothetical protein